MPSPMPLVAKLEQQKHQAEQKLAQVLREMDAGGASSSQKKRAERARKAVERLRGRLRTQAGTKADRRISDR